MITRYVSIVGMLLSPFLLFRFGISICISDLTHLPTGASHICVCMFCMDYDMLRFRRLFMRGMDAGFVFYLVLICG